MTASGSGCRIEYGAAPLEITGATAALASGGANIRPDSLRTMTFGGARSATVPAGAEIASDMASLTVDPANPVAVTLYLRGTTGPATFHSQAWADSYVADGDHLGDPAAGAFTAHTSSWYYLDDVEVAGTGPRRDAVVAFGDSITDGFGSTPGADRRWPDELAARLARSNRQWAVLNEGIGGNLVLNDSAWYGERATGRFEHDVLDKPGVRSVIVLEGVNDLGFSETDQPTYKPAPDVPADAIIAGYESLIDRAHAKGVRVVGATLLPFGGSDHYSARAAVKRHAINTWIRTSGRFDAVADFAAAMADPGNPESLPAVYDSGDHLHPNDAGYRHMAESVNIDSL